MIYSLVASIAVHRCADHSRPWFCVRNPKRKHLMFFSSIWCVCYLISHFVSISKNLTKRIGTGCPMCLGTCHSCQRVNTRCLFDPQWPTYVQYNTIQYYCIDDTVQHYNTMTHILTQCLPVAGQHPHLSFLHIFRQFQSEYLCLFM